MSFNLVTDNFKLLSLTFYVFIELLLLSGHLTPFSFLSISYFISNQGNQRRGVVYKGLLPLKFCHLLIQSFYIAASRYRYSYMITWERPQSLVTYTSQVNVNSYVRSMLSTFHILLPSLRNEIKPYSYRTHVKHVVIKAHNTYIIHSRTHAY